MPVPKVACVAKNIYHQLKWCLKNSIYICSVRVSTAYWEYNDSLSSDTPLLLSMFSEVVCSLQDFLSQSVLLKTRDPVTSWRSSILHLVLQAVQLPFRHRTQLPTNPLYPQQTSSFAWLPHNCDASRFSPAISPLARWTWVLCIPVGQVAHQDHRLVHQDRPAQPVWTREHQEALLYWSVNSTLPRSTTIDPIQNDCSRFIHHLLIAPWRTGGAGLT
jgi:hypothetical protein